MRQCNLNSLSTAIVFTLAAIDITATEQKPDFSGVWLMDSWSADVWPVKPPYTAAGRAAQEALMADPESDPTHHCIFQLVRITSAPFPHEIIQEDDRITILYENEHQIRRVFMDERGHPADSFPTLMGHSIGTWDGDTLIIDTTGIAAGYLRPQGYPHTENLHVVERHTLLPEANKKRIEITIDDPEYYTRPWTASMSVSRINDDIQEYNCMIREHLPGRK